jgi:hypothetical protein
VDGIRNNISRKTFSIFSIVESLNGATVHLKEVKFVKWFSWRQSPWTTARSNAFTDDIRLMFEERDQERNKPSRQPSVSIGGGP